MKRFKSQKTESYQLTLTTKMSKYSIKIKKGQSVYDVSIQEYGTIEGVDFLLEDNPELDLFAIPGAGTFLLIRETPELVDNKNLKTFRNKINVNTANDDSQIVTFSGLGYMSLGVDFIIS